MQSSVNTFNDYVDYVKGNDSEKDYVEESDAVLIYNSINPKQVLILGIIYLILGAILGITACIQSGFLPLGIGCIGGIVILLYSGGPFPISYLPIGEIVSGFVTSPCDHSRIFSGDAKPICILSKLFTSIKGPTSLSFGIALRFQ